jgi:phosphatidylethanolamine-binding protein (PEBP) family uncharacterized protein
MNLKPLMAFSALLALSSTATAFEVKFTDSAWNGMKIPTGQQCQKFGGDNPMTPKLMVLDIPAGSDALILEYSDRDSEKMNNGGHGIMKYSLTSSGMLVQVPAVPGHTFSLPARFTSIEAHRSPGWDTAGAYMPPCSGGKDHEYYLTVKAVKGDQVNAETVIEMGKY